MTDEYYLSLFTPEQPDLNWENPEVRAAVHDVMNFWLERGACGYSETLYLPLSRTFVYMIRNGRNKPNKQRSALP